MIGDTANTSARLCSIALAGQIVISESTYAQLGGRFETEELQPAKVKGKDKPVTIYNVIRSRPMSQVPANAFIHAEPTNALPNDQGDAAPRPIDRGVRAHHPVDDAARRHSAVAVRPLQR